LKVGAVVSSLVEDVIMPAVLQPALKAANIEKIAELSYNGIFYGKFISSVIDFVVVAGVVYFIINSFQKKFSKEA
jgi:large conductance mechanosensitive channel